MKELTPIQALIAEWPTRQALADEVGAKVDAVHKWAASGRIPSGWQAEVVSAAQRRGFAHVTAEWMLEQHSQTRSAA